MLVGIANREDPDKNAEACLIWVCTVCLDLLGWQLEFNISRKKICVGYSLMFVNSSLYVAQMHPNRFNSNGHKVPDFHAILKFKVLKLFAYG